MNIAIIGASAKREKFGNKAVRAYLQNLSYTVFPVNPKEKSIEGLKCYSSVLDIKEHIDVATLYVPAGISMKLVSELKKKRIPVVYINPGAESDALIAALKSAGIERRMACSIKAIGKDPAGY